MSRAEDFLLRAKQAETQAEQAHYPVLKQSIERWRSGGVNSRESRSAAIQKQRRLQSGCSLRQMMKATKAAMTKPPTKACGDMLTP